MRARLSPRTPATHPASRRTGRSPRRRSRRARPARSPRAHRARRAPRAPRCSRPRATVPPAARARPSTQRSGTPRPPARPPPAAPRRCGTRGHPAVVLGVRLERRLVRCPADLTELRPDQCTLVRPRALARRCRCAGGIDAGEHDPVRRQHPRRGERGQALFTSDEGAGSVDDRDVQALALGAHVDAAVRGGVIRRRAPQARAAAGSAKCRRMTPCHLSKGSSARRVARPLPYFETRHGRWPARHRRGRPTAAPPDFVSTIAVPGSAKPCPSGRDPFERGVDGGAAADAGSEERRAAVARQQRRTELVGAFGGDPGREAGDVVDERARHRVQPVASRSVVLVAILHRRAAGARAS